MTLFYRLCVVNVLCSYEIYFIIFYENPLLHFRHIMCRLFLISPSGIRIPTSASTMRGRGDIRGTTSGQNPTLTTTKRGNELANP